MNLYTIKELANKTKYAVNTLYKKKDEMTLGIHYFQQPKGKILFSDEAISFLLQVPKGKHDNESIKRDSLQKKGKSLSIYKYFS